MCNDSTEHFEKGPCLKNCRSLVFNIRGPLSSEGGTFAFVGVHFPSSALHPNSASIQPRTSPDKIAVWLHTFQTATCDEVYHFKRTHFRA